VTRFVVCGEALIDLVASDDEATTFRSTWQALSAGGPMNSAVALAKLGVDSHFLGRISRDAFGGQLRSHLVGAGVELDLATESSQPTSLAVVTLDEHGKAQYTFHFADTANFGWQIDDLPTLGEGDWLHVASLATVIPPGAEVLLRWLEEGAVAASFDINVRPSVIEDPETYWDKVKPWLRAVGRRQGVVKASDDDIAFLAQAESGGDPLEVAAGWVEQFGLGLAVITLGPGGGVAVSPGGDQVRVPGFPTDVVDTVGAGDTFMAGFLDGYVHHGQDLAAALRRGAAAASIVCARQGAQPPTADEVDALLGAAG